MVLRGFSVMVLLVMFARVDESRWYNSGACAPSGVAMLDRWQR
jgi:hypothetical protein